MTLMITAALSIVAIVLVILLVVLRAGGRGSGPLPPIDRAAARADADRQVRSDHQGIHVVPPMSGF